MSSPAQKSAAAGGGTQPREVIPVSVLAESELGSEAQRERRKRILDATLAIASKGGYEAVQMRAVADRADVAVGTLYRYFPSKVHLLVSALGREFERIDTRTDRSAVTGGTPYQRLSAMVSKLNRAMQRNPLLTEAMTRAYVFADASAAGEVDHPAVARGIRWLIETQTSDGLWDQKAYTGGGFPRVFYLRYHGYPKFFPLWAVARYRNLKRANDRHVAFGM